MCKVLLFTCISHISHLLFFYIVCIQEKNFPLEICKNMTDGGSVNQDNIDNVQKRAATLEIIDSILPVIPTTIVCLFLGAWSDVHGRKPILVASFLCSVAMLSIYTINYAFFFELNVYHLFWVSGLGFSSGKDIIKIAMFGYIGILDIYVMY